MSNVADLRDAYELQKVKYERLTHLVTLILTSRIKKEKVKIHSIKQRVKQYASFVEKIQRKQYQKPFKECTDLAGCRVICLFLSQVEQLKKLIHEEFQVVEVSDKKSAKKFDQFGYLSLHMLVKIPKKRLQFVEYKELQHMTCEIQIRTILQEAWAEIEHYLNYKATKQEKNDELLRKMFSLSGMFEVADSTFEEINKGFSSMVKKKLKKPKQKQSPDTAPTALELYKFVSVFFKDPADWDKTLERRYYRLSKEVEQLGVVTMGQFETIIGHYTTEMKQYQHKKPDASSLELMRVALAVHFKKKFDLVYGLKGYSQSIINYLR